MGCGSTNIIVNESSDNRGVYYNDEIKEYIEKSENSTCKIITESGFGSGFFCKIPFTKNGNNYLDVLFTCEHVIKKRFCFFR